METITVIIQKPNTWYCAHIENLENVCGMGDSVQEAKDSALKNLRVFLDWNDEEKIAIHNDYKIRYRFV